MGLDYKLVPWLQKMDINSCSAAASSYWYYYWTLWLWKCNAKRQLSTFYLDDSRKGGVHQHKIKQNSRWILRGLQQGIWWNAHETTASYHGSFMFLLMGGWIFPQEDMYRNCMFLACLLGEHWWCWSFGFPFLTINWYRCKPKEFGQVVVKKQ